MIQISAIVQNKGIRVCHIDAKMFDENIRRFINCILFFLNWKLMKGLFNIMLGPPIAW